MIENWGSGINLTNI